MPDPTGGTGGERITPLDIWDALEHAGASAVQAAGIMGNFIHESNLNVESAAQDSNGYMSYGLASWNSAPGNYPNAASLVTGNPRNDLRKQIALLTSSGGLRAASGTTVKETASNFAAGYERCADCQSGGSQNDARQLSATTVAGWAASGNWPVTAGSGSDTAQLAAATTQDEAKKAHECAWSINFSSIAPTSLLIGLFAPFGASAASSAGQVCVVSKSQVRTLLGVALLGAGIVMMAVGVGWVVKSSPVGGKVGELAGKAAGAVAMGVAPEAAPAIAMGERKAASSGREVQRQRGQAIRRRQSREAERDFATEQRAKVPLKRKEDQ